MGCNLLADFGKSREDGGGGGGGGHMKNPFRGSSSSSFGPFPFKGNGAFPSGGGIWIFSGTTHFKILNTVFFHFL